MPRATVCLYCADDPGVWREATVWPNATSVLTRKWHILTLGDDVYPVSLVWTPFSDGPQRAGACDENGDAECLARGTFHRFRLYP